MDRDADDLDGWKTVFADVVEHVPNNLAHPRFQELVKARGIVGTQQLAIDLGYEKDQDVMCAAMQVVIDQGRPCLPGVAVAFGCRHPQSRPHTMTGGAFVYVEGFDGSRVTGFYENGEEHMGIPRSLGEGAYEYWRFVEHHGWKPMTGDDIMSVAHVRTGPHTRRWPPYTRAQCERMRTCWAWTFGAALLLAALLLAVLCATAPLWAAAPRWLLLGY